MNVSKTRAVTIGFALLVLIAGNAMAAVTTDQIADGAVTTSKIDEVAVTTPKIADGAVGTFKIRDGAVTDAKIGGQISASKISSIGLNADTVDGKHATDLAPAVHNHAIVHINGLPTALAEKSDVTHNHDALYQQKYGKMAVVARTGGDYSDPVSAMNALSTWCGTPSETNKCLLKIMPGIYDIGAGSLQMQSYVDMEGAGENATTVTGNNNGSGVLRGATNAEVRFLTVEATSAGTSIAVLNDKVSPKMTNVTAISKNGTVAWGVKNNDASPVMLNVTAIASGTGEDVSGNHTYAVGNIGTASAPMITNITAIAKEHGDDCYGIYNENSSPIITTGNITADCATQAEGVFTTGTSANVKLSGLNVTSSHKGVWNRGTNATATMKDLTVTITNKNYYSCAVMSDYGAVLKVDHSILNSGYASLCGGYYGGTVYVADSRLEGATALYDTGVGLSGKPQAKCINLYDGNYDALSCP